MITNILVTAATVGIVGLLPLFIIKGHKFNLRTIVLDLVELVCMGGVAWFTMIAYGFGFIHNMIIGLRGSSISSNTNSIPMFVDDEFGVRFYRYADGILNTPHASKSHSFVELALTIVFRASNYYKAMRARVIGAVVRNAFNDVLHSAFEHANLKEEVLSGLVMARAHAKRETRRRREEEKTRKLLSEEVDDEEVETVETVEVSGVLDEF